MSPGEEAGRPSTSRGRKAAITTTRRHDLVEGNGRQVQSPKLSAEHGTDAGRRREEPCACTPMRATTPVARRARAIVATDPSPKRSCRSRGFYVIGRNDGRGDGLRAGLKRRRNPVTGGEIRRRCVFFAALDERVFLNRCVGHDHVRDVTPGNCRMATIASEKRKPMPGSRTVGAIARNTSAARDAAERASDRRPNFCFEIVAHGVACRRASSATAGD